MEKSGQRAANPEIIDEPRLVTKKRIFFETSITLGFWGLVLYLIALVITFILWLFGVNIIYTEIYRPGFSQMIDLLQRAGRITSVVVLLELLWCYYNYITFRIRGERRGQQVNICYDDEIAKFFKVDLEELEKVKKFSRVIVVMKGDAICFAGGQSPPLPTE
jgi:poly-beta-1,6-N-acetyl-D-glucosamine biosynthesis protein PgaD